jgi:hypothetical protein
MTMHVKKISKPASAATGYDPAAIITAKAAMIDSLSDLFQIQRFFGIDLTSKE